MNTKTNVRQLVRQINRRQLKNNTQRVLLALLTAGDQWVSRSSLRVPSAGARLRDLRKAQFGQFNVECRTASELKRSVTVNNKGGRVTFYRINPQTVTVNRVMKAFEGVILAK